MSEDTGYPPEGSVEIPAPAIIHQAAEPETLGDTLTQRCSRCHAVIRRTRWVWTGLKWPTGSFVAAAADQRWLVSEDEFQSALLCAEPSREDATDGAGPVRP